MLDILKLNMFFFCRGLLQAYKELDVFYRAFLKTNYGKNKELRAMKFLFVFNGGGLVIFQS